MNSLAADSSPKASENASGNALDIDGIDAALHDANLALPIDFRFCWLNRKVGVRVMECEHGTIARLAVDLGLLPYSAEAPHLRRHMMCLRRRDMRLPVGAFMVSDANRLLFCNDAEIENPVTGGNVISAVARTLLQAAPYLELARKPLVEDRGASAA